MFQEAKSIVSYTMIFLAHVANNFLTKLELMIPTVLQKCIVRTTWEKKKYCKDDVF